MRFVARCSVAFTTIALVAGAVSCRKPETNVEKGNRLQILHRGNGQEVQDLDPQIVNSTTEFNILSALLEGLVAEDPVDLHPVPGVGRALGRFRRRQDVHVPSAP
jgi:oligopeptide transport system substrate-binding protein